jgi:hypothetical protein
MEKEHVQDLLIDYLDNSLTPSQQKKVVAHLKECAGCSDELTRCKKLFAAFDNETQAIPIASIRTNFLRQLENEKQRVAKETPIKSIESKTTSNWLGNSLKLAAGLALLIGSFLLGKYQEVQRSDTTIASLQTEGIEIRETAILALMENKSASRRIQGVNFVEEFENPDKAIVTALIDRMLHDDNVNVRSAAVDALSRFSSSEVVKLAFIRALEFEKDPGIQIAVLENLVRIQAKKAVGPMKKLMEQEDTQPFVKKEIHRILLETT